jgi:hypothetical protein
MADKPRWIPVADPYLADELSKDPADLSMPVTWKPNGHLWAQADQFEAWRVGREQRQQPS